MFEAGADHRFEDADGKSVLDNAITNGREDIVQLLASKTMPKSLWSIEVDNEDTARADENGTAYNQTFVVTYTRDKHWPAKRFRAFVQHDLNGEEAIIRGPVAVDIADDGNALIVCVNCCVYCRSVHGVSKVCSISLRVPFRSYVDTRRMLASYETQEGSR